MAMTQNEEMDTSGVINHELHQHQTFMYDPNQYYRYTQMESNQMVVEQESDDVESDDDNSTSTDPSIQSTMLGPSASQCPSVAEEKAQTERRLSVSVLQTFARQPSSDTIESVQSLTFLRQLKVQVQSLLVEVNRLRESVCTLQAERDDALAKIRRLSHSVRNFRTESQDAVSEAESLKKRIADKDAQIAVLRMQLELRGPVASVNSTQERQTADVHADPVLARKRKSLRPASPYKRLGLSNEMSDSDPKEVPVRFDGAYSKDNASTYPYYKPRPSTRVMHNVAKPMPSARSLKSSRHNTQAFQHNTYRANAAISGLPSVFHTLRTDPRQHRQSVGGNENLLRGCSAVHSTSRNLCILPDDDDVLNLRLRK